ncbi:MAG: ABC transporter permease [Candidatus Izemoplasmatales bacterium]|nr:ABC transporter permease [Candidatus Izemoplasmatales bacterium]
MKNILTIFKKEWDRVIKDKRLVMSVMILPGLMIFLIYSFIGNATTSMMQPDDANVAIVNAPQSFINLYESVEDLEILNTVFVEESSEELYVGRIDEGNWDVWIVFDDDFGTYDGTGDKPGVRVYFNPNNSQSQSVYNRFSGYLYQYQNALSLALYGDTTYFAMDVDNTEINQDIIAGRMFSMILPMLVIMFLFSGAMSIGPESIAGEKERGTIATLLITPVKRTEIAIGKVFSLSVLSLISTISSFIGIIASFPKLFEMEGIDSSIYGVGDYVMLLLLLFSTVFVIVGMISILSAYAKNLKEAGTLIVFVYIATILVGVTSMFSESADSRFVMYLIPIYNSVQTMKAIFTFETGVLTYLLVSIGANIVYAGILIFILNKMFQSERIMFAK